MARKLVIAVLALLVAGCAEENIECLAKAEGVKGLVERMGPVYCDVCLVEEQLAILACVPYVPEEPKEIT